MEIADPNFLVKPPKKERTEAQKAATVKAFAALKAKREAMNQVVAEVKPELLEKPQKRVAPKQEKPVAVEEAKVEEPKQSAPPQEDMVQKILAHVDAKYSKLLQQQKPETGKKKKVVIVEDSSSSEEEVVIRRKKEKPVQESKPAPVPFQTTGSRVLDKLLNTKF